MTARPRAVSLSVCIVVTVVALIGGTVAGSRTADAAGGAVLASDIVYRVDPDRPAIDVEATYRMTNVQPDQDLGGGRIEYYFFTGMVAPIEDNAAEIDVEVDGRDGDFTVEVDQSGYSYLDISFGYQLRYNRTATVVVTYTLLGDEPRDERSIVRVNPAYVAFPVLGWGDPGAVDVRVELPIAWDPTFVGSDLESFEFGDIEVFQASEIDDPDDFFVFFTARDDRQLDRNLVFVDDHRFSIASWPGDEIWLDFATRNITRGLPALERVIGVPWPITGVTTVTEASTAYLDGYAGFFDTGEQSIEIGEDIDVNLLLHELSHAWFNHSDLGDRFLVEGLAEEVATRAMYELDRVLPPLRDEATIAEEFEGFEPFPLLDWPDAWSRQLDDGDEDFGYAASQRVIRTLWNEIGDDAMRELLAAVVERERAYPGDDVEPLPPSGIGWKEFLDLAEQIGGSRSLVDVYDELVLDDAARRILAPRAEAIASYRDFVERSADWDPPELIRGAMARWYFALATEHIDQATETLAVRDRLLDELDELGLTTTDQIEEEYERIDSGDFDEVTAELESLLTAAAELVEARRALSQELGELGLDVPELTQSDYVDDPYGIVDATRDLAGDAALVVAASDDLRTLLDSAELEVPDLAADAFVDDPTALLELIDLQSAAARTVIEVREYDEAADAFVERVGRYGTDLDDDIARLADELADGDYDEVVALGADIRADIDDLDDVGRRRIATVGGTTAGVLLALLVLITWRRRRRSRHTPVAASNLGDAADPTLPGEAHEPRPEPAPVAVPSGDGPAGDAADQADAGKAGALDPD